MKTAEAETTLALEMIQKHVNGRNCRDADEVKLVIEAVMRASAYAYTLVTEGKMERVH